MALQSWIPNTWQSLLPASPHSRGYHMARAISGSQFILTTCLSPTFKCCSHKTWELSFKNIGFWGHI